MGSGSSVPTDKHIVIIGCGYGGKKLAQNLMKLRAKFTVIDAKDSFHHCVASVRTVVDESYASKMFVPYKPLLGDHYRQGKVVNIDSKSKTIFLDDGDIINYDILVIATGSTGPMKEFAPDRNKSIAIYSNYAESVKKSDSIVFIGGGAIGIETACEIKTEYPKKEVTVIHSASEPVLSNAPAKFHKSIKSILRQLNVNVIYDDRAVNIEDIKNGVRGSYEIKTARGKTVKADLVFKTTGLKVNKGAYENSLADAMDERGALKVTEFFEVVGHKDIYAIGDCNNIDCLKLAYITNLQADLLANNLVKKMKSQPMQPWNSRMIKFLMGVAMGRRHGVGCTAGGCVLPEFMIVRAKSSDLMIGALYKEFNLPTPK